MGNKVLSIKQMQHLKELGVDTSDASMSWIKPKDGLFVNAYPPFSEGEWRVALNCYRFEIEQLAYVMEAFTLQDIIEKLPSSINWNPLIIVNNAVMYCAGYGEGYDNPAVVFQEDTLLESAYEMLCWCAEKGYLNEKKKWQ